MTGRRVHERYHGELPIVVVHEGRELQATTANLGLGGVHLISDELPAFGAIVELRFRVPGMKAYSICNGTVRWVRGNACGIQFGSLRPIDVWGLNQFFKTLSPESDERV